MMNNVSVLAALLCRPANKSGPHVASRRGRILCDAALMPLASEG
jgi:hypothetical protein